MRQDGCRYECSRDHLEGTDKELFAVDRVHGA